MITFCFPTSNFSRAGHSVFTQCWLRAQLSYGYKKHNYLVYLDCSRSRKLITFTSTYIMIPLWLSDLINVRTVLISSYFSFIFAKYAMQTEAWCLLLWFPSVLWFFIMQNYVLWFTLLWFTILRLLLWLLRYWRILIIIMTQVQISFRTVNKKPPITGIIVQETYMNKKPFHI